VIASEAGDHRAIIGAETGIGINGLRGIYRSYAFGELTAEFGAAGNTATDDN